MRKSSGFTVLELAISMAIISILIGTAAISIEKFGKNKAADELVGELRLAGIAAIRRHTPVVVGFMPNTTLFVTYVRNDNGGIDTKLVDLGAKGEVFMFDPAPPGGGPAPVASFIFSPMGFISTPAGNVGGNIYITNQDNSRRFRVQSTFAGSLDLQRYDPVNDAWIQIF